MQVRQERVLLLEKCQALEAHKTQVEADLKLVQSKLSTSETHVRALESTSSQAADFSAQVQHLRADNARLVRLLSTTAEYKSFVACVAGLLCRSLAHVCAPLAQSVAPVNCFRRYAFPKDGSGKHGHGRGRSVFMPSGALPVTADHSLLLDVSARSVSPSRRASTALVPAPDSALADTIGWQDVDAYMQHYATLDSTALDPVNEVDHWIPSDAIDLASEFRRKHLSHVPPLLIREFLMELNQSWRKRFNKQVASVKERCASLSRFCA